MRTNRVLQKRRTKIGVSSNEKNTDFEGFSGSVQGTKTIQSR